MATSPTNRCRRASPPRGPAALVEVSARAASAGAGHLSLAGARRLRLAAAGRLAAALHALQLLAVELIGHVVAGGRLVLRRAAALARLFAGHASRIRGRGRAALRAVGAGGHGGLGAGRRAARLRVGSGGRLRLLGGTGRRIRCGAGGGAALSVVSAGWHRRAGTGRGRAGLGGRRLLVAAAGLRQCRETGGEERRKGDAAEQMFHDEFLPEGGERLRTYGPVLRQQV